MLLRLRKLGVSVVVGMGRTELTNGFIPLKNTVPCYLLSPLTQFRRCFNLWYENDSKLFGQRRKKLMNQDGIAGTAAIDPFAASVVLFFFLEEVAKQEVGLAAWTRESSNDWKLGVDSRKRVLT